MRALGAVFAAVALLPGAALAQSAYSIFVPSTARAGGANGAFYTTALSVVNPSTAAVSFTLRFLGHDKDGTSGPERTYSLSADVSSARLVFSPVNGTSNFRAYASVIDNVTNDPRTLPTLAPLDRRSD